MKKVWAYIKRHHEEYGVALFVVPVLLIVLALIFVGDVFAWLFK
jgi:Tfp pilus assembly protein PilX